MNDASLRASAHAGVAPKGIPFGHNPPNLQSAKGEQPQAFPWEGGAPRSESK